MTKKDIILESRHYFRKYNSLERRYKALNLKHSFYSKSLLEEFKKVKKDLNEYNEELTMKAKKERLEEILITLENYMNSRINYLDYALAKLYNEERMY